jgi:hypothetical protein
MNPYNIPTGSMKAAGITFIVAIGTAIAIVIAVLVCGMRSSRAEPLTFRNDKGQVTGYGTRRGNETTFQNNMGQSVGRAVTRGNTTTIYNEKGQQTGTIRR